MTRAGYFEGHRLMVSHSNEYRAPAEGEKAAIDELMKSVRTARAAAEGRPRQRARASRDRRARPRPDPARAARRDASGRSWASPRRWRRSAAGLGLDAAARLRASRARWLRANLLMVLRAARARLPRELRRAGGLARRARLGHRRRASGPRSRARSCSGASCSASTSAAATWANRDRHPEYMPWAVGVWLACGSVLQLPAGRARRSRSRRVSPIPPRRPGPEPAAAEPPADGHPPALPLPGLRGDDDPVRPRVRGAARRAGSATTSCGRCGPG